MLRCAQSPAGNTQEMSVLERQKAILQRLYYNNNIDNNNQQQQEHSSQTTNGMPLFPYQNLINSLDDSSRNFGFACSEITTTSVEIDQHQRSFSTLSANSSRDHHHHVASTKKRKAAEFDVEEECKDKRVDGEAGEVQSELTVKSEKENSKENSRASDLVQKTDYIHVRARRGQATDSHSLAERARREKISKKMKCLQDLVPGCNKVTGKAGMLDEIINYVQSLQKQVEFLSMKLSALNPRLDFNVDNFFAKEFPAFMAGFPTAAAPIELVNSTYLQYNQGPQGSTSSGADMALNLTQMLQQRTGTSSISFPELYLDSVSSLSQVQQMATLDSDWQSLYNGSFH